MSSALWANTDGGASPSPGEPAPWMSKDDQDEEAPDEVKLSSDTENSVPTKAATTPAAKKRCRLITLLSVSGLFFALFIYSASVQTNDPDSVQWTLFYALHASIAGMYILHISCCFPDKIIYVIASAMSIWSVAFLAISAVNLNYAVVNGKRSEEHTSELSHVD